MNSIWNKICRTLTLGEPMGEPVPLSGGYTHRMYALTTTQGRYAVKLLNPEIMARPDALNNYGLAEAFETLLQVNALPILPAMDIFGHKLHCISGQYLYIFRYFDGHVLKDDEITPDHCYAMGNVLARIHAVCRRPLPEEAGLPSGIDWPPLVAALLRNPESRAEGADMHRALPMLIRVTRAMTLAAAQLPREEALCHNDMDAKNVLWQGNDFRIIDLECLGWADPGQEALDLAISWAGWPAREDRFKAFLRAYRAAGGTLPASPAILYDSRRNHLDWLAYNARRAVPEAAASDPEERRIGREQIVETLGKLEGDQRQRSSLLQWMEEVLAE